MPCPAGASFQLIAEAGGAGAADQLAVLVDDEDADRADVAVDAGGAVDRLEVGDQAGREWSASTACPSAVVPPSGRTTTSPTLEAKIAVKLRLSMSEKTSEPHDERDARARSRTCS